MKKFLIIFSIVFMAITSVSYAQPKIPIEKIPSDTPLNIKKQIERLYSSSPLERAHGAYWLGTFGHEAAPAIPFLLEILNDNSSLEWQATGGVYLKRTSPGYESAVALGKIGEPAVEPIISLIIKNERWDGPSRMFPMIALSNINDERAVQPLIMALKNKIKYVRSCSAEALGKIKDARAVEPLIAVLKDEDLDAIYNAIDAVGKIKDVLLDVEPYTIVLKVTLKNENSNVEIWTRVFDNEDSSGYYTSGLNVKGDAKDIVALQPLFNALSRNLDVVYKAGEALGKIKSRKAIEPLTNLLMEEKDITKAVIAKALKDITG